MTDLSDIGKLLIKIGGVLIMVLGVLGALRYAVYLILLYVARGILDMIMALNPILAGFSVATGLIATLGSVILITSLVLNAIFAYFGFRLLKAADKAQMPAGTRDEWVIMLTILLVLSILFGSMLLAASFLLPIIGLAVTPVQRTRPQEQA